MLTLLFIGLLWPLTVTAKVFKRHDHGIKPRGRNDHHGHAPSQSIVTVTVDWLPPHGPGITESSAPPGYGSSAIEGETNPGVVVVTVTSTKGAEETSSSDAGQYTDMYPPPAEPTTVSSTSTDINTSTSTSIPPFGFTTTVTYTEACQPPQSSTSSSPVEVKTELVTVTVTDVSTMQLTTTVTVVYSTVVRTLSTRGPYAPPLTTW